MKPIFLIIRGLFLYISHIIKSTIKASAIFILSGILFLSAAQSKQNDLQKNSLKGKVKTVKNFDKSVMNFNKSGNIVRIDNCDGFDKFTKKYVYDKKGQLISTELTNAEGILLETEEYSYDNRGNCTEHILIYGTRESDDSREFYTYNTYNDSDKLINIFEKNTVNIDTRSIDYWYDEHGNLSGENMVGIRNGFRVESKTTYQNTYWQDGKLRDVVKVKEETIMGSDIKTYIDTTEYSYMYDHKGNKTSESTYTHGQSSILKFRMSEEYDSNGNLTKEGGIIFTNYKYVLDAKGNWKTKTKLNSQGKPVETKTRTITYY